MTFDTKVPESLKELQVWFGGIIRQKLTEEYTIQPTAPSGAPIQEEAAQYIAETGTLSASERMELYNQSYWYRLIDALHDEFPTVVRLFGESGFNKTLAIDYLHDAPPRHWSLNFLGDRFIHWLEKNYRGNNKSSVLACALLDWTCQDLLLIKKLPSIIKKEFAKEKGQELLTRSLCLQSTARLFSFHGNYIAFRKELLSQEPNYWLEHNIPSLDLTKEYFFIIFRGKRSTVEWHELPKEEHAFLSLIDSSGSLNEAINVIENHPGLNQDMVEENLSTWAQKWLINDWITTKPT